MKMMFIKSIKVRKMNNSHYAFESKVSRNRKLKGDTPVPADYDDNEKNDYVR